MQEKVVLLPQWSTCRGESIWQKQYKLKQWFDREYTKEYPGSKFHTGQTLVEGRSSERKESLPKYDEYTIEKQERKENLAYMLNCMLMSLGVNISDNFREG